MKEKIFCENIENQNYETIFVNTTKQKETVYSYLKHIGLSENYVKNLRKKLGYIVKNNYIATTNEFVTNGDTLKIFNNPNTSSGIMNCIIPLDIVYEDEFMLIVNKPQGLATMPTKSHYFNNLAGAIVNYMNKKDKNFVCRILTRLDKDTAGIVLVAKNAIACHKLETTNLHKTYYALAYGNMTEPLIIDTNIKTNKDANGINVRKRFVTTDGGKECKTMVQPIKNYIGYFLAKINLISGRTHQIRVHLASISHPILGDSLYNDFNSLDKMMLIAKEISFISPFNNKELCFTVDYPQYFKPFIN